MKQPNLQAGKIYVCRDGTIRTAVSNRGGRLWLCDPPALHPANSALWWDNGLFADDGRTETPHDMLYEVPEAGIYEVKRVGAAVSAYARWENLQWYETHPTVEGARRGRERSVDCYRGLESFELVAPLVTPAPTPVPAPEAIFPKADLIRAVLDGKVIEQYWHGKWNTLDAREALLRLSSWTPDDGEFRVKLDPVTKEQALEALRDLCGFADSDAADTHGVILRRYIEEQS
jgi:hypothetical protein